MEHEIQQKIDSIMANMAEMRRALIRFSAAHEQAAITMIRLNAALKEEHS